MEDYNTENKDRGAFACVTQKYIQTGLTKREHFASMALQGILSCRDLQKGINMDRKSWAEAAVKQADDLLEELAK